MRVVEEIRLLHLKRLVNQFGSVTELNKRLGRPARDATLSQIYNRNPDSKTGRPRDMGSGLARSIEEALEYEKGFLDNDPDLWPFIDMSPARFAALPDRLKGKAEGEIQRIVEEWENKQLNGTTG